MHLGRQMRNSNKVKTRNVAVPGVGSRGVGLSGIGRLTEAGGGIVGAVDAEGAADSGTGTDWLGEDPGAAAVAFDSALIGETIAADPFGFALVGDTIAAVGSALIGEAAVP